MKKIACSIIATSLLITPMTAWAEKTETAENVLDLVGTGIVTSEEKSSYHLVDNMLVFYNNKKINIEQPAAIADGRTLLPMRVFFDGIGYEVGWNEQTKVATVYKEKMVITIRTESGDVYINAKLITLDV